MSKSAIEKAVQVAGSQSALARALSITPQAVSRMCANNRVSAKRAIQIEKLTGVSRKDLCPQVFDGE